MGEERDSSHRKRAMENRTFAPAKRAGRTNRAPRPDAPQFGAKEKKGAEDEHPTTREVIHFPKLSAQDEIRPARFGKPASVRNRLRLWLATKFTYRIC